MIEYEYSFKVKDIKPYIKYCEKNGFTLERKNNEKRNIYKNDGKLIARITTIDGITTFDLKEDNAEEKLIKTARESLPITLQEGEINAALSMLEMLDFAHHTTLKRSRIVYKKGEVTFEIDSYTLPEEAYVVAIEGDKAQVDDIYKEISTIEDNYYRITYEEVGIYEALELNLPKDTYKKLLADEGISWLPKTNNYKTYKASFFTSLGFNLFNEKSLPLISKYLDSDRIKVINVSKLDNIIYQDEYQIIIEKDF